MSASENVLDWLQSWYAAPCDGDGEHEGGVKIETRDWATASDPRAR
ncbi:Imm53 family immunity protein [Streptomyces sp. NPDC126499]